MSACTDCGIRLDGSDTAEIAAELQELSEGDDSVHRVKARLRQLSLMLGGLCCSCAHHAARRDWSKCRKCRRKNYAPATRCKCGGELWGITYPKDAA